MYKWVGGVNMRHKERQHLTAKEMKRHKRPVNDGIRQQQKGFNSGKKQEGLANITAVN